MNTFTSNNFGQIYLHNLGDHDHVFNFLHFFKKSNSGISTETVSAGVQPLFFINSFLSPS